MTAAQMKASFGQHISGLTVDDRELRAGGVNGNEVRAAAGIEICAHGVCELPQRPVGAA